MEKVRKMKKISKLILFLFVFTIVQLFSYQYFKTIKITGKSAYKQFFLTEDIYENSKSYYCSNYKNGCKTSLWKEASYFGQKIKINKDNAKKLLSGEQVVFKIKSKSGKEYNAHFGIEINGDYLNLQRKDFIKIEK